MAGTGEGEVLGWLEQAVGWRLVAEATTAGRAACNGKQRRHGQIWLEPEGKRERKGETGTVGLGTIGGTDVSPRLTRTQVGRAMRRIAADGDIVEDTHAEVGGETRSRANGGKGSRQREIAGGW